MDLVVGRVGEGGRPRAPKMRHSEATHISFTTHASVRAARGPCTVSHRQPPSATVNCRGGLARHLRQVPVPALPLPPASRRCDGDCVSIAQELPNEVFSRFRIWGRAHGGFRVLWGHGGRGLPPPPHVAPSHVLLLAQPTPSPWNPCVTSSPPSFSGLANVDNPRADLNVTTCDGGGWGAGPPKKLYVHHVGPGHRTLARTTPGSR
jgi:hypothetical protein